MTLSDQQLTDQPADDRAHRPGPGPVPGPAPTGPGGRPGWRATGAGGRWRPRGGRLVLWLLVIVVFVNGVERIIEKRTTPSADQIATIAAAKLGRSGFPAPAAETFVTRFAMAYMSWDPKFADARKRALAGYVADDALQGPNGQQLGWDGSGRQTAYIAVPAGIRVDDDRHAAVTVAVLVDDGSWKYLQVPVFADGDGGLAVTAPPAYVDAPTRAVPDQPAPAADTDQDAVDELTKSLPGFFAAYAASQADQLAYLVPNGTRIHGLDGVVRFAGLGRVTVPAGGSQRVATVNVTWSVPMSGPTAKLTQTYALTIVRSQDRWYVQRVQASPTP